jgi:hypothetical protein
MTHRERTPEEMRAIFDDHIKRQDFEHTLIDRKTTWLLASQALLFTAYGVTFNATTVTSDGLHHFRLWIAVSGLAIAAIVFLGVLALIFSKWLSWKIYEEFYRDHRDLPGPLDRTSLQWGVLTWNTPLTLLPDVLLPWVFIVAWSVLL